MQRTIGSTRAALYARGSSEQQATAGTIASQVEALKERIAADGLTLDPEMCFLDLKGCDRHFSPLRRS